MELTGFIVHKFYFTVTIKTRCEDEYLVELHKLFVGSDYSDL